MAKQKKQEPKEKAAGMVQISISLSKEVVAFLDSKAKENGRTRAGEARFFLGQMVARGITEQA